jgi:signal transduction histidine kinase
MHVFIDNTDIVKLEEANNNIRCQKIMFASVSHEFRTPLNAIMNSYKFIDQTFDTITNLIRKNNLEVDSNEAAFDKYSFNLKKFIKMGFNSSVILLALIEDILDLSKFEAGTFAMCMSEFKIRELIDEVHEIFYSQCQQKKLQLLVDFDPQLTGVVMKSDKNRLKQILLNLMSNSFKFTFKGSITIFCRSCMVNDQEQIEMGVSDTGIGIKEEDQPKLFKLFSTFSSKNKLNPHG